MNAPANPLGARRPYRSPAVSTEIVLEQSSLACGKKQDDRTTACRVGRKDS